MDRIRLTPEVERQIASYIRAGGYAHVSAAAAGVPQVVYHRWLARGRRRRAIDPYRSFWLNVLQAEAQARLGAEMEARKKDVKFWLRYGPGKDVADGPAWGACGKVPAIQEGMASAEVREVLGLVLHALATHPEAKAAVLQAVTSRRPGQTSKHVESSTSLTTPGAEPIEDVNGS
jgi:hypothetical protein